MNFKILKSKKILAIGISGIFIVIALGVLIYFNYASKTIETSVQPEENIVEEADGEYIDINELEEEQENMIEENVENNSKENNTEGQSKNQTTNTNKSANTVPYYIKVNYGAQVVTVYKKDENGDYTVPIKAMVCSTGVATPKSGVYSIPARWRWLGLQGGVCGQYCTQIKGNILFHSVPYLEKGNPASLEYWEYDKLGTYASAGCIRLTVSDAMWIYNNCAKGTKVEFYSSMNPGPLGKPSAKKISSYPDNLRNWDPTDPNPNNPWKSYQEPKKTDTNNNKTNTTVQNNTTNTTLPNNTNNSNVIKNEAKEDNNNVVKNEVSNITTNGKNEVIKNETTKQESEKNDLNQNNVNIKTENKVINTI
ncbi:MAG: L,D-transpeptidase [Clostridia bacterium]|nr:L,D-transpeptidase [Clostridia bacterium]